LDKPGDCIFRGFIPSQQWSGRTVVQWFPRERFGFGASGPAFWVYHDLG
jgi:hypothetical protein